MSLLLFLYDILFLTGLTAFVPLAFLRRKMDAAALAAKFGARLPDLRKGSIWIQAVSVGEVTTAQALVEHLRKRHGLEIVISTTTLAGNALAREKYGAFASVIFFPFDISWVAARFIRRLRPRLFVSVETEMWPNLYFRLKALGIPVIIVNGRISDSAFARYRLIKPLMKRVLSCCSYIGVQNEQYRRRFLSLGCGKTGLSVAGQMKFETIAMDPARFAQCAQSYGTIPGEGLLIVAGSTHPGEEEIMLGVFRRLRQEFGGLRLLLAPRHPERVPEVERRIREYGFQPVALRGRGRASHIPGSIYILDTVGELRYFYSIADICVVGGSFRPHGGHNILEPIYLSKPTLFGPRMENFRDVEELVLRYGAGVKVADIDALETQLRRLVRDSGYRGVLGARCASVFAGERSSVEEHMELISQSLHESKVQDRTD